jgi:hypothetical protein
MNSNPRVSDQISGRLVRLNDRVMTHVFFPSGILTVDPGEAAG